VSVSKIKLSLPAAVLNARNVENATALGKLKASATPERSTGSKQSYGERET
jgi:hypothetical protein